MPPSTDAIAELARIWRRYEGDPDGALRAITETAASALKVARASVWLLEKDGAELTCHDLYEVPARQHSHGIVLRSSQFPGYFAALAEEETIPAHDALADPRTCEFAESYLTPLGIGAMLDAPIRTGLRLVGVLCHEHVGGPRTWTPTEQKDAAFLGSLASLTLELKNRAAREALLSATLESTAEGILACDDQRVLAFNRRFVEMWGLDLESLRDVPAVREHIAHRNGAALANALLADTPGETARFEVGGGRVVERSSRPQIVQDRVVGRVWSFRDVTAQRDAEAAAVASDAKVRLAILDNVTGLYTRRYILEQLDDITRHDGRLVVALIDIDDLKKVNDRHGTAVGDAVLRDFARHLGERLRDTDLVGRYGNEELVMVLRGASIEAARVVLEQVRAAIGDRGDRAELPRYTFSAGIAALGTDGKSATEILAKADERLYEAKRAGRDRIV